MVSHSEGHGSGAARNTFQPKKQFFFDDPANRRDKEWDCSCHLSLSDGLSQHMPSKPSCPVPHLLLEISMSTSAITWAFPLQHQPNRPSYSSTEKRFWHFASSLDLLVNSYQWKKTLLFDWYAAYLARSGTPPLRAILPLYYLHLRNGYDLDLFFFFFFFNAVLFTTPTLTLLTVLILH